MSLLSISGQTRLGVFLSVSVLLLVAACSSGSLLNETAYVVPEKLRLKNSTAQAARVVGELKSGDKVSISGRAKSEDGTPWVNVKGPEGQSGWAESRYFVQEEIVNKSRKMADDIRGIQTQAVGKSKATLRLRLTPDRTNDENVATTLPSGTVLEIVARERKPRPVSVDAKSDGGQAGSEAADSSEKNEVKYDDWLQVRLKDYAVLPAGWIYGGSVELEIPGEIIYYLSSGRRITGWQKLGMALGSDNRAGDHYLVLERKVFKADERVDFDRVKVLAYDPASRDYSTPFREDVSGQFPVSLKMEGQRGSFRIIAFDKNDQKHEFEYDVEISGGKVKVTKLTAQKTDKK